MIAIPADALTRQQRTALASGLVAPRPIAWVSTLGVDGLPNLAPFSFFNVFATTPFTVAIGISTRDGADKDSLRNIRATEEFTVSMVTAELASDANQSSADFEASVSEWEIARVTPRSSVMVKPPGVAESPAILECRVSAIMELGGADGVENSLVVANVVYVHVAEAVVSPGGQYRIDADAIDLVGRIGGGLWATTRDRVSGRRPTIREAAAGVSTFQIKQDPVGKSAGNG